MIKIRKEPRPSKPSGFVYVARGVSVGKDPVTGKRMQRTLTGDREKDVKDQLHKLGYQVSRGTYRKPWDGLVPELLDSYEKFASFEKAANTLSVLPDGTEAGARVLRPLPGQGGDPAGRRELQGFSAQLRPEARREAGHRAVAAQRRHGVAAAERRIRFG